MPDRYDNAVCATELRSRNELFDKIRSARRPQKSFELENAKAEPASSTDSETSETSTCPEERGRRIEDISDLYHKVPRFEDFV